MELACGMDPASSPKETPPDVNRETGASSAPVFPAISAKNQSPDARASGLSLPRQARRNGILKGPQSQ